MITEYGFWRQTSNEEKKQFHLLGNFGKDQVKINAGIFLEFITSLAIQRLRQM